MLDRVGDPGGVLGHDDQPQGHAVPAEHAVGRQVPVQAVGFAFGAGFEQLRRAGGRRLGPATAPEHGVLQANQGGGVTLGVDQREGHGGDGSDHALGHPEAQAGHGRGAGRACDGAGGVVGQPRGDQQAVGVDQVGTVVGGEEVHVAVPVRVCPGHRGRGVRVRRGPPGHGLQALDVEVHRVRAGVPHRQVEVAVPVGIGEGDGGRRAERRRGPGRGGLQPCAPVHVDDARITHPAARGEVEVPVPVDVAPGQGRGVQGVVREPGGRRLQHAGEVEVHPVGAVGDPDRQVQVGVPVHVPPNHRGRGAGLGGGPGLAQAAEAVVLVEPIGLPVAVAQDQVEIAVAVDVGPGEGGGLDHRARDPAGHQGGARVLVDLAGTARVADGEVEVPVPVHVAPGQGPGGVGVGRDPGSGGIQALGRVEVLVDPDQLAVDAAHGEVEVPVPVPVAPGGGRGGVGDVGGPGGGAAVGEGAAAVVGDLGVGPRGRQVEVSVPVPVTPNEVVAAQRHVLQRTEAAVVLAHAPHPRAREGPRGEIEVAVGVHVPPVEAGGGAVLRAAPDAREARSVVPPDHDGRVQAAAPTTHGEVEVAVPIVVSEGQPVPPGVRRPGRAARQPVGDAGVRVEADLPVGAGPSRRRQIRPTVPVHVAPGEVLDRVAVRVLPGE